MRKDPREKFQQVASDAVRYLRLPKPFRYLGECEVSNNLIKKNQNKESMALLSTLMLNPEKLASALFSPFYKWKGKNTSMILVS